MVRVLHVAALPFPSPQGTQALIHHMLMAHREAGYEPHLLCYAHGDGRNVPYAVHRTRDFPRARSLRSGPSWHKPLLDVSLAAALRELRTRLAPELVIAHHVEAAACAAAVGGGPWVFYAHTDLAAELPTYLGALLAMPASHAGRSLDRFLVRRAPRVCAVSADLAARLRSLAGRPVSVPPLPWPVSRPITRADRVRAREQLQLAAGDEVVLYAGNLDAYQGLDRWLSALRLLAARRPKLIWWLATASDPSALLRDVEAAGLAQRVRVSGLDEASREQAYAAADLAVVPRLTPGGVPVKLLDALARGVPVVAARRAAAGLPLAELAWLVDDTPQGYFEGVTQVLDSPSEGARRRKLGRAYIALRHHATAWSSHPALALREQAPCARPQA